MAEGVSEGASPLKVLDQKLPEIQAAIRQMVDHRRNGVSVVERELEKLNEALGWFLVDERFQVAVGGNPTVVERMIADAQAVYKGIKGEFMSEWQPLDCAPKDGTWFLLRGSNSAGHPMIPVVCAWRMDDHGHYAWRDSASLRDMTSLVVDVPPGSSADWMPLPLTETKDQ